MSWRVLARPGETTVGSPRPCFSFLSRVPPLPPQFPLSDRVVRFGESEVLAPSLDDVVSAGQPVSFIGFGCHSKGGAPGSYAGRLVPFSGGAPVAVPVTWLGVPHGSKDGCGWLVGRVDSPQQPGLWTFEPPANLSSRKGTAAVEFNVVSATAPTTPPAEVKPK